jgi:RNA polymerase sigma-70 factor, ECF subfamily
MSAGMEFTATTRLSQFSFLKEKLLVDGVNTDDSKSENEQPDEALMVRVMQSDRESLAVLFRRHLCLVRGIGRRVLRDAAEADDLAQDVFLHISRKCHLYNHTKGSVRSWIVRLTYYKALNRREYLEGRQYYSALDVEGPEVQRITGARGADYDSSGEALFGRAYWGRIQEVLSEDQWETIRLHFFEGCTFSEIGKRRNLPVGTVRHHFYRGLARLRNCIFQDEVSGC